MLKTDANPGGLPIEVFAETSPCPMRAVRGSCGTEVMQPGRQFFAGIPDKPRLE